MGPKLYYDHNATKRKEELGEPRYNIEELTE